MYFSDMVGDRKHFRDWLAVKCTPEVLAERIGVMLTQAGSRTRLQTRWHLSHLPARALAEWLTDLIDPSFEDEPDWVAHCRQVAEPDEAHASLTAAQRNAGRAL